MPNHRSFFARAFAAATLVVLTTTLPALAQTERLLHSFGNGTDGSAPSSTVTFDSSGNLYGQTETGGAYGKGIVFQMSPKSGGGWTYRILHSFGNGSDGAGPIFGPILYAGGNLYGTTTQGGTANAGTAFELSPKSGGGWSYRIIHSFGVIATDGCLPWSGLIIDASGNLYGTASSCGGHGYGSVFELSPNLAGSYTEKALHNFSSNGTDGTGPYASLIFDATGNLYGTTISGGTAGGGTAFELSPAGGGLWTEEILHNFGSALDGNDLQASLILDAAGNLYGTTLGGGTYSGGTAFELSPAGAGSWTYSVLYNFGANPSVNGKYPGGNLLLDSAGNLYGTTESGGNAGVVFKLVPQTGGGWAEVILHNFQNNGKDGQNPGSSLVFDSAGNLYSTTGLGGAFNAGTVFEIIP